MMWIVWGDESQKQTVQKVVSKLKIVGKRYK